MKLGQNILQILMHKMVRYFNEIWNIFPVSFPELDDNNLVIS